MGFARNLGLLQLLFLLALANASDWTTLHHDVGNSGASADDGPAAYNVLGYFGDALTNGCVLSTTSGYSTFALIKDGKVVVPGYMPGWIFQGFCVFDYNNPSVAPLYQIATLGIPTGGVIDNGVLFSYIRDELPSRAGYLRVFDLSNGNLKWNRLVHNPNDFMAYYAQTPLVVGNRLYWTNVSNGLLSIWALDANTGVPVWSHNYNNGYFFDSLAYGEGKIFLQYGEASGAQTKYRIEALDAANGAWVWGSADRSWPAAGGPKSFAGPIYKDGIVYASPGRFAAFRADTGAEVWSNELGAGQVWGLATWGAYLLYQDTAVAPARIAARRLSDGVQVWQTGIAYPAALNKLSVSANGIIYASGDAGEFYALNANNGAIIWQRNGLLPYATPVIYRGLLYASDNIYGGTEGRLLVIGPSLPPNQPPVAEAGPDNTTVQATDMLLNGSGYDPDGNITKYEWQFQGIQPADCSLNDIDGVGPLAILLCTGLHNPGVNMQLTVYDNNAIPATGTDTMSASFTAISLPNQNPVAVANDDTGPAGVPLVLTSLGSNDPDGTITSYSWTYDSGDTAGCTLPPIFTSPDITLTCNAPKTIVYMLTVTDDDGASSVQDDASATFQNTAPAPTATDDFGIPGNTLTLSSFGNDFETPDNLLTFAWTPNGAVSDCTYPDSSNDLNDQNLMVTCTTEGVRAFSLTVTDLGLLSGTASASASFFTVLPTAPPDAQSASVLFLSCPRVTPANHTNVTVQCFNSSSGGACDPTGILLAGAPNAFAGRVGSIGFIYAVETLVAGDYDLLASVEGVGSSGCRMARVGTSASSVPDVNLLLAAAVALAAVFIARRRRHR